MNGLRGGVWETHVPMPPLQFTRLNAGMNGKFSLSNKVQRLQKCNFSVSVLLVSSY
jgi:hypothetical protein